MINLKIVWKTISTWFSGTITLPAVFFYMLRNLFLKGVQISSVWSEHSIWKLLFRVENVVRVFEFERHNSPKDRRIPPLSLYVAISKRNLEQIRKKHTALLLLGKSFLASICASSFTSLAYVRPWPCKRTQHCWPTTRNIVGPNMLRPFAWNHNNVGTCWYLLRIV